jgi:hypothetical protein
MNKKRDKILIKDLLFGCKLNFKLSFKKKGVMKSRIRAVNTSMTIIKKSSFLLASSRSSHSDGASTTQGITHHYKYKLLSFGFDMSVVSIENHSSSSLFAIGILTDGTQGAGSRQQTNWCRLHFLEEPFH